MTAPARRPRVHVLYEHGPDLAAFSTAHIRLLRPLSHPGARGALDVTAGRHLPAGPLDAVIVDRLWSPAADRAMIERLVGKVRAMGARLLHAIDDNFLDLPLERRDWAAAGQPAALELLLRSADGLLVSTDQLAERLAVINPRITVLPNALDERLLDPALVDPDMPTQPAAEGPPAPLLLGYMGTFTHDADLGLILPALRAVLARHPGRLRLQVLGVAGRQETMNGLQGLPLDVLRLTPEQSAYPRFLPWFTQAVRWDIALAPLAETPFNRCKSDIKHLDYAAQGAAAVFSDVPAYRGTVRHGQTGLLVPNRAADWEAALESLIADASLRERLARGASGYLRAERTLAGQAWRWAAAIEAAVSRGPAPALASRRPLPLRLQVLAERDEAGQALAPSQIRLLRPLRHPGLAGRVEARFRPDVDGRATEAVILDRLWKPNPGLDEVRGLVARAKDGGAAFLYSLDDNLLDLPAERPDWPTEEHLAIVRYCLAEADGVLCSSHALAERLRPETRGRLAILPNALDERLLSPARPSPGPSADAFGRRPLTVGYMGTATHDDDLAMVLPALRELGRRHGPGVRLEVIGGARRRSIRDALRATGLAVRFRSPPPGDDLYPSFLAWFAHRAQWDIALAPLRDTPFRRCKSDIKLLDYAAIGAAGLYSDLPPYADTVRASGAGLLVGPEPEAWLAALERLVADEELRRSLGEAGRRYLDAERTLARRVGDWERAIAGLIGGS